ncbi:UNKNOWN [Stylonychia lemnae]|uniref:Uncharacterized protein n=1 Tax=Stylonychia lemnae TaxID=5949 RepID=A0A077ZU36_STYLE|nr:UNKNOWN [Stylonychia lemnae]|eukprot:CDW73387.1 UNKNOWN [Stylonychia lemnae]
MSTLYQKKNSNIQVNYQPGSQNNQDNQKDLQALGIKKQKTDDRNQRQQQQQQQAESSQEESDEEEEESDEEDDDEEGEDSKPQVSQPQQPQQRISSHRAREEIKSTAPPMRIPHGKLSSNDLNLCYTDRLGAPGRSQLAYLGQNTRPQAWINQKNLQIKFLESENSNLKRQIQDQDQNLRINKDMLSIILGDLPEREKQLLEKMNQENQNLIELKKQVQKEHDDIAANLFIQQQIIEDLKSKEDEQNNLNEENIKNLQDKLEKKEYALQVCELKIYHYEKYLQRKALTETEGRSLLFKFQQDDPKEAPVKISNVVEDNMNLKQELKEAFQEVNRLQKQTQELSERIIDLEDQLKQAKENTTSVPNSKPTEDQEMSIFDQTNVSSANFDQDINLDKLKRMEKYFPQEYQNRLELLLVDMEKQLKASKKERKFLKNENIILKESNDSNQYVIQQLNLALNKATSRIKALEDKMGEHDIILAQQQQIIADTQITNIQPQTKQNYNSAQVTGTGIKQQFTLPDGNIMYLDEFDQKVLEQLAKKQKLIVDEVGNLDPDQFGNLSSIMINPNEISNAIYASNVLTQSRGGHPSNFNFAKEMEMEEKQNRQSLL